MLTRKQSEVLHFIQKYYDEVGYAPSYAEIAEGIATKSRGSITKHIDQLERKGFIKRTEDKIRRIQILKMPNIKPANSHPLSQASTQNSSNTDTPSQNAIPLVGKIAAGRPILAYENIERIDLNHYLSADKGCYLLEVVGDSMIGCGIFDGDLVLIQSQPTAENGQIIVALVDGFEATLKRYKNNFDGTVHLIPENPTMEPMLFDANRVMIQGILIAQIRRY